VHHAIVGLVSTRRKEGQMRVVVLAVGAICAGCLILDPVDFPAVEGVLQTGECMCAVCSDEPFCLDGRTGDSVPAEDGECPEGTRPSVPASRLTDIFERVSDLHCVPDFETQIVNYGFRVCPADVIELGHVSNLHPCFDIPECARPEECTETPEPGGCEEFIPTDSRRTACEENSGEVPEVRAMRSLIAKCAVEHGEDVPSDGAVRRYCFVSCLHEDSSTFGDRTTACDPDLYDPPGLSHDSIVARVDPDASSALVAIAAEGEVDEDSASVSGTLAIDVPTECVGPLPADGFAQCQASVPFLELRAVEGLELFDTSITDIRLQNPQPIHDDIVTFDGTSIFSLPEGALLYASADIEGAGPRQGAFAAPEPDDEDPGLVGFIDWEERELTALTVLRNDDGTAALGLVLQATIPNLPPSADAGPDQVVECAGPDGATVTLSAAGSTDPDGPDDLAAFVWGTRSRGALRFVSGADAEVVVPFGETVFGLMVSDGFGASDVDSTTVLVVDAAAPEITEVGLATDCLWPPNHSLRLFRLGQEIRASAADVCDGAVSVRIADVRSNQPADATGDGATAPDVAFGSGAVCVRAERSGNARAPREYTVVLEATDLAGNTGRREVVIRVPHDQSPTGRCDTGDLAEAVPDGDPRCVAGVPVAGPVLMAAAAGRAPEPAAAAGCSSAGAPLGARPAIWLAVLLVLSASRRRATR
jgi:hypothetical protein